MEKGNWFIRAGLFTCISNYKLFTQQLCAILNKIRPITTVSCPAETSTKFHFGAFFKTRTILYEIKVRVLLADLCKKKFPEQTAGIPVGFAL